MSGGTRGVAEKVGTGEVEAPPAERGENSRSRLLFGRDTDII